VDALLLEVKNRGVSDIFIACMDGLEGLPEAIEAVYPRTQVQICNVYLWWTSKSRQFFGHF
jgi:transposase-like protein